MSPLLGNHDVASELVVEAYFGESPVADNNLGVSVKGAFQWLDVLPDGRIMVGFGTGEVQGRGVNVLILKLLKCSRDESGLTDSIGSQYDYDHGLGHQ